MYSLCHNKPAPDFFSFAGSREAAEEALEKLSGSCRISYEDDQNDSASITTRSGCNTCQDA